MQRAFKLMPYTGQRQQDALKLEWTKYVDGRLSVRQRKTGALIDIPAAANLKVLLNSLPRMSTHVLTDALGRPRTQRAFGSRWRETTLAAGLTDRDLKNMDLRGTAMVRLAEAGATPHDISAISAHDIHETMRILETYVPRTRKMADAAIAKWDKAERRAGRGPAFAASKGRGRNGNKLVPNVGTRTTVPQ